MALHTIEICSGVGMLGEGLRAGLDHLGIQTRTVCHIEREAFAASVLASRIEEGSLDEAPVWGDLLTFDAGAWRGTVDCVVAGFPCQDLSVAGRRAGLDGKRSGLFFNILDIADACGAQFLFLENVAGIASATASVVDPQSAAEHAAFAAHFGAAGVGSTDGRLLERAASRVLGELADRGWNAEWIALSAASVGASHKRERWFCWAWRQMDNTGRMQRKAGHEQDRPGGAEASGYEAHDRPADRSGLLGNPQLHGHPSPQDREGIAAGNDHHQTGALNARELARPDDADGQMGYAGLQHQYSQQWIDGPEHSGAGGKLDNPERPHIERPRDTGDMACPCSQDQSGDGGEQWPAADGCGQKAHGSTGELRRPLFAPGPNDSRWADIIPRWPHLAPSLPKEAEPQLCGMVDGLASGLDDTRTGRLRAGGNGVVAICAAQAVVELVKRMTA